MNRYLFNLSGIVYLTFWCQYITHYYYSIYMIIILYIIYKIYNMHCILLYYNLCHHNIYYICCTQLLYIIYIIPHLECQINMCVKHVCVSQGLVPLIFLEMEASGEMLNVGGS